MNSLNQLCAFLEDQYKQVLGMRLRRNERGNNSEAIWIDGDESAWLLDPEVGIALFVVPYVSPKDELNLAIQKGLSTTTLLQPRYDLPASERDTRGIWQVGVLWLVDDPQLSMVWRTRIAQVRRESGFTEELGIDAILPLEGEDFAQACVRHGAPQLLFHTRRLFALQWAQMPGWLSANDRVAEMLRALANTFANDSDQQALADQLVKDVFAAQASTTIAAPPEQRKTISDIEVSNFRNLSHCHLRFPKNEGKCAQAHVLFGPNGTGKTSIFEALAISLGRSSKMWAEFDGDTDLATPLDTYPETVLRMIGGNRGAKIAVDGKEVALPQSPETPWRNLEGSFLGQEDTRDFLNARSDDIGQRILKGYSTLAEQATQLASNRERVARDFKAAWLRDHGLNPTITRRDTRAQRLIERELDRHAWMPSPTLLEWLKTSVDFTSLPESTQLLADRWERWKVKRTEVATQMANAVLLGAHSAIVSPLQEWLKVRNELLARSESAIVAARPHATAIRQAAPHLSQDLSAWAKWLTRPPQQTADTRDHSSLMTEINTARQKLEAVHKFISFNSRHLHHLKSLGDQFLKEWETTQPNTCPTCGQDHTSAGGIRKVITTVENSVVAILADLQNEEQRIRDNLSKLEMLLASAGVCPISQERQLELENLVRPFLRGRTLSTILSKPDDHRTLERQLKDLETLPHVPGLMGPEDMNNIAASVSETAIALDAEAERVWKLPERWESIVTTLRRGCDRIVAEHLPETLQKVWWEIALCLTAARWNLVGKPEFQVKGQAKLLVSIKAHPGTPARYFFNQAERHVMGLAWFFTRYLTHGRFHFGLAVMDDPAQEMDETTFRGFGRFVQAFIRIHESNRLPLQLIVSLHQEERAFDLARLTLGRFLMLTWQRAIEEAEEGDGVGELRLLSEGYAPQNAVDLLFTPTTATH